MRGRYFEVLGNALRAANDGKSLDVDTLLSFMPSARNLFIEVGSGRGELAEWFIQLESIGQFTKNLAQMHGLDALLQEERSGRSLDRGIWGRSDAQENKGAVYMDNLLLTFEIERKFFEKTLKRMLNRLETIHERFVSTTLQTEEARHGFRGTDYRLLQRVGGKPRLNIEAALKLFSHNSRLQNWVLPIWGSAYEYFFELDRCGSGDIFKQLAGVFMLFPDPLDSKKGRRRRQIVKRFLQEALNHLKRYGFIFIVTDHHDYAAFLRQSLEELLFSAQKAKSKTQIKEVGPHKLFSYKEFSHYSPAEWGLPETHYYKKWRVIKDEYYVFSAVNISAGF